MMNRHALDVALARAADEIGTPCYVYVLPAIEARIAELRAAFQDRFALSFAVKSNPNPALLAWLEPRIEMLDVSSIGELRLAVAAGWDASRASFTGPAKRAAEIREAIAAGVGELVLESVREAQIANGIARELGRVQNVMIRIAPSRVPRGFGDQMAGRPVAFGIDWEDMEAAAPAILALPSLRVIGLHIYSGTQCLRSDPIVENYRHFLELFRETCARHGLAPAKLVFGSGLGIPYHDGDEPLDLADIGAQTVAELDALTAEPAFRNTRPVLELGRFLVGEAGYFVTRVVATKQSRGTRFGICDGGMNNHLPASGHFGMVVRRNYAMHRIGGGDGHEPVDLVGPLCTSIDRLAVSVSLPRLTAGDLIAVHGSGAYGLTVSPMHFISHAPPKEVLLDATSMRDVTRFQEETAPIANQYRPAA